MKRKINPNSLKNLRPPWPKGFKPTGAGTPPGKRISTWIAELGQLKRWPDPSKLPNNALIAMALIRKARGEKCEYASEIIMERTEGAVDKTLHIKADGVLSGMTDEQKADILKNAAKNTES